MKTTYMTYQPKQYTKGGQPQSTGRVMLFDLTTL
jgi:hypothetical protein